MNKANEVIMRNHDYIVKLAEVYELELSEVYGDLAICLCEQANKMDLNSPRVDSDIRTALRRKCERLIEKRNARLLKEELVANFVNKCDVQVIAIGNLGAAALRNSVQGIHQEVLDLILQGYNLTEISTILKIPYTEVCQMDKAIRHKVAFCGLAFCELDNFF